MFSPVAPVVRVCCVFRGSAGRMRHRYILVLAALFALQACAGQSRRMLTIGGVGGALAAGGAGLWVAGTQADSGVLVTTGVVSVAVGAALIVTATSLLAYRSACQADADCEEGKACRQVPAPAGREPYGQCVPR